MPSNRKISKDPFEDIRQEMFNSMMIESRATQADIEFFTSAPKAWLNILRIIESKGQRGAIKKALLQEGVPIDVLTAEEVIYKIERLLHNAHRKLMSGMTPDQHGHPKYETENIAHARDTSIYSIQSIQKIPEIGLLPENGNRIAELPIESPNRRNEFIASTKVGEKKNAELIALLKTAEQRIKQCVRETSILTKQDIDIIITDLVAIIIYCDNELKDIKEIINQNEILKNHGVDVQRRIQELRKFKFPIRRKQLAQIYLQLGAIFANGLGKFGVTEALNNVFGREITPKMILNARNKGLETSQIIVGNRNVADDVFKKAIRKRRSDESKF